MGAFFKFTAIHAAIIVVFLSFFFYYGHLCNFGRPEAFVVGEPLSVLIAEKAWPDFWGETFVYRYKVENGYDVRENLLVKPSLFSAALGVEERLFSKKILGSVDKIIEGKRILLDEEAGTENGFAKAEAEEIFARFKFRVGADFMVRQEIKRYIEEEDKLNRDLKEQYKFENDQDIKTGDFFKKAGWYKPALFV